jgi:hypothetical protein
MAEESMAVIMLPGQCRLGHLWLEGRFLSGLQNSASCAPRPPSGCRRVEPA